MMVHIDQEKRAFLNSKHNNFRLFRVMEVLNFSYIFSEVCLHQNVAITFVKVGSSI